LEEARRAVAERRSKIKPVAAESSNDPVSTMRKIEARTVLRTMQRQEIVRILASANPDPIFVEAVLEAQPFMVNNIGGALRAELERTALQRQHGPEIEEIELIDNALTLAATVTAVATEILRASCAAMTSRRALNWSKPPEGTAIKERDRPAS